jgi:hypothetical protein
MAVCIKARTGGITHDAGRARDLVTDAVEHATGDAGQGRGCPGGVSGVLDDAEAEVVVEVQDKLLAEAGWIQKIVVCFLTFNGSRCGSDISVS